MNMPAGLVLATVLLALPVAQAQAPVMTVPDPGFRPDSALESRFLEEFASASIAVYPTTVRRVERTAHSFASQAQVIDFLNQQGIGHAMAAKRRIDQGRLDPQSQWDIFEAGLRTMAEVLGDSQLDADYSLLLEILVPGDEGVFGIECYIVDRAGENAFSFLLNAHHRMFAEAGLFAGDAQAERDAMMSRATTVALQALREQIALVQACASPDLDPAPIRLQSDLIVDFETGLPSGTDAYGIPLGYLVLHGERSSATISTTSAHPPLPGQAAGNSVLQLDVESREWAGVLHRFENDAVDRWVGYDLRDAQELSFWLFGRNKGTTLIVDLFDNRRHCSVADDAERYSYMFIDDFSGWKLLSIPLEVLRRKGVGNDAPEDGLGLSPVHGWALWTLSTKGKVTYFVDDVRLRSVPLLDSIPEGLSRENDIWVPINELPMFGGYTKTTTQVEADEELKDMLLPRFKGDENAAAEHFARTGWNLYYGGDRLTAIKRFNQAWMIDPENQHALWGFAVISRERGKMEAALKFYQMAVETGHPSRDLLQEYEHLRRALEQRP